jgi:signal transduction histidine kinase
VIIPVVKKCQTLHACGVYIDDDEAMPNQTKHTSQSKQASTQKMHSRSIALDSVWVPIAFLSAYAISSHFNFSDNYYIWARQYEQGLDIDELLPALLASLVALLWFAKRRINESKILIKKNHALLQRILEVQEDERKRIARDLHDDLGQYLSAIKAQSNSLLIDASSSADVQLTAKSITSSADHAYDATRNMIHSLRPVALDDLGLSAALEHLLDTWRSISTETMQSVARLDKNSRPTNYQLHIHGDIDSYHETVNITVFRIVQEALTNIAKHARAQAVLIDIESKANYLTIAITDDGVGFDISKQNSGYGLLGIAERVEALAGNMEISSQAIATHADTGTKINIRIKV